MGLFPPVPATGWHCPGAASAPHLSAGLGLRRVNERHVQVNTQTMQPAPLDQQIFTTSCGEGHGDRIPPSPWPQGCVQESGKLNCPEQPRAAPASPDSQARGWRGDLGRLSCRLGEAALWAGESCGWARRLHWLAPWCMEPPAQLGSTIWDIQGTCAVGGGEQGFSSVPFLVGRRRFLTVGGPQHCLGIAMQGRQ